MIDQIDSRILAALQEDARISHSEIARRVGMAPSAINERIRKLEERQIITGYQMSLNARALGYGLVAFVFVRTSDGCWCEETARRLIALPEVLECHSITGEDCYLVKLRVRDTDELNRLLRDSFASFGTILSTKTTIVLETAKETLAIPIREVGDEATS